MALDRLSEKLTRLKEELVRGVDKQGKVLPVDEKMMAVTHIVQQEFIIHNHRSPTLVNLGNVINPSHITYGVIQILGPDTRRALLMSASTYELAFFISPQGIQTRDAIRQEWISHVSTIADRVENGVNDSDRVRVTFYDLRDAIFARFANAILGYGIPGDRNLHIQVLDKLNRTDNLMKHRLGKAFKELDDTWGMSRLQTSFRTHRVDPDGFNQTNQLMMVEKLFRFYQGLRWE